VAIAVQRTIWHHYAVLAACAVSEFGVALLKQLDTEDIGELRRLLGVDRFRDGRLLDAPEKARQLGVHPNTLVRMAREGRISATKVGRSWRFPARHERDSAAGQLTADRAT
jgi:excisionase family DNA binding protein